MSASARHSNNECSDVESTDEELDHIRNQDRNDDQVGLFIQEQKKAVFPLDDCIVPNEMIFITRKLETSDYDRFVTMSGNVERIPFVNFLSVQKVNCNKPAHEEAYD